jgi:hypothetical protein
VTPAFVRFLLLLHGSLVFDRIWDMGLLLRAITGFLIAYATLNPVQVTAWFQTPEMGAVRADITAQHPRARLRNAVTAAPSAHDAH